MSQSLLVVRAGARLCAFPVGHVIETMRPQPFEALPDVPAFVLGVSIIRGRPTPVVALARLLGGGGGAPSRFVTLRSSGDRAVAVGVDAVIGLRDASAIEGESLPPLLKDVGTTLVSELARLDGELLTVLRAAHLVPENATARVEELAP